MRDSDPGPIYSPGTSPFHIRGNVYVASLRYVNEHVPGGLPALERACPTPELASFVLQDFENSAWYDVLPIVALTEVTARLAGVSAERFIVAQARQQASEDLVGVRRLLLKAVSPRTVALFLPKLTSRYYDWGGIEARLRGPRQVETIRTGVPEPLVSWYAPVSASFAEVALELAGAHQPRVTMVSAEPDGAAFGVPTRRILFDVRWDD